MLGGRCHRLMFAGWWGTRRILHTPPALALRES